MKLSALILFVLIASCTSAQQFSAVPFIHSHNDYLQEKPLIGALEAGVKSIEIDLFFKDGCLYVAHTMPEITPEGQFEKLYIIPLKKYLAEPEDINEFHFMIDIKSEPYSTLKQIEETLKKYPEMFSKERTKVIISGKRPKPEDYDKYADFIWFDGREPADADGPGGNKIALISQNLSKFTRWRGKGKIPEKDSLKLVNFVQQSHIKDKPVRLWNSGDNEKMYSFLCSVGVDYINTDIPELVRGYLDNTLIGKPLPDWKQGYFDIHQISTGRGNTSFLVYPDGTTMLIDMGDMSETHPRVLSPRNTPALPNNSKTPAQWVAGYIRSFHPKKKEANLDYALITHYHDDHFGEIDSTLEKHEEGGYLLTGIMELGSYIPIRKIIDRGYSFPIDLKDEAIQKKFGFHRDPYSMIGTLKEYWKFIDFQKEKNSLEYEEFTVGSSKQFKLLNREDLDFKVHNLFANGIIKNKYGQTVFQKFNEGEYPGENNLSTGIKISYGDFDYFIGGDIRGIDEFGQTDPNSMESKAAPVIGPVDAAVLNHHGNRDSQNPVYVSVLQPRVWVQPVWSSDHPGDDVLRRIASMYLYPGKRDIFATSMLEANKLVIGSRIERSYKSMDGHIVIRVYPNGKNYSVFVLNDKNDKREISNYFYYTSK